MPKPVRPITKLARKITSAPAAQAKVTAPSYGAASIHQIGPDQAPVLHVDEFEVLPRRGDRCVAAA
jgi:hypothetical protein